jgi:asparagine synthase (glutamine-hydrolysing)
MCGLAAIATFGGEPVERQLPVLDRMVATVAHRGPDEQVVEAAGQVAFGFSRLSLVDPAGGGQPLSSADGSISLIANGEVYNHRELAARSGALLRTASDCEILVHLYERDGIRFLDDVIGMYAIVLHDRRRNRLVLARDRFGVKPLYFHRTPRGIVLASEIKALFAHPDTPREVDWTSALANPALSFAPFIVPTELATWFAHIESVPAASVVEIDLADGSTRTHRYWDFPGPARDVPVDDNSVIAEYGELLAQSVSYCANADAEIGLFLSGGVDSSAVAALACRHADVHTFSVLSGSTYLNGDAQSAHRIAAHLGLPNHQIVFDAEHTPSVDQWRRLVWLVESPQTGPEIYFKHELHRAARDIRPDLKGMLLGAASDEFNGGYMDTYVPGGDWYDFVRALRRMSDEGRFRSAAPMATWWANTNFPLVHTERKDDDTFARYFRWEYGRVQQYNVWHEDRSAAGSGIEARVPFLDHRIIELVGSLPAHRRAGLLADKHILRASMNGILPAWVATRPKVPFFHGDGVRSTYGMFARMLAAHDFELVNQALDSEGGRRHLDANGIRAMARTLQDDPGDSELELLLRVVNLGLLDAMVHDLPSPLTTTPAGPVGIELPIASFDAVRPELEALLLATPSIDPDDVPVFGADVTVLRPTSAELPIYIAVNGSVQFVIDEDSEPGWQRLLRALDGRISVAELVARVDGDADVVLDMLAECRRAGLVAIEKPVPASVGDVDRELEAVL